MLNSQFGLSLRFGPPQFTAPVLRKLAQLPFGVLNVPLSLISEGKLPRVKRRYCIVSNTIPYSTVTAIADEGSEKMKQQLCLNFAGVLDSLAETDADALVLDPGFSDESLTMTPKQWSCRIQLLRQLWAEAYRKNIKVLLPVRYPLNTKETEKKMRRVIEEAMCANMQLIADIRVHDIKRIADVEKTLAGILFDVAAVRLNWNAADGNVLLQTWFDPWKEWCQNANPRAPVIFEPHQPNPEAFLTLARELAEMADITGDLILR